MNNNNIPGSNSAFQFNKDTGQRDIHVFNVIAECGDYIIKYLAEVGGKSLKI